jgi:class 3 adenylate cyclase
MEKDQLSRKLAVILHADVVGSTALVQQNEALAHERIKGAFDRFSEIISSYSGITREIRGDALVAEFDRASDAVSAALAFQISNRDFNSTLNNDILKSHCSLATRSRHFLNRRGKIRNWSYIYDSMHLLYDKYIQDLEN